MQLLPPALPPTRSSLTTKKHNGIFLGIKSEANHQTHGRIARRDRQRSRQCAWQHLNHRNSPTHQSIAAPSCKNCPGRQCRTLGNHVQRRVGRSHGEDSSRNPKAARFLSCFRFTIASSGIRPGSQKQSQNRTVGRRLFGNVLKHS